MTECSPEAPFLLHGSLIGLIASFAYSYSCMLVPLPPYPDGSAHHEAALDAPADPRRSYGYGCGHLKHLALAHGKHLTGQDRAGGALVFAHRYHVADLREWEEL